MMTSKTVSRALASVALVGFCSAEALAGTCQTEIRNFPAGTENIQIVCVAPGAATTNGTVTAQTVSGTKSLVANLVLAPAGRFARSEGLNAAGTVIAGCTAQDNTPGGATSTVACAAAVKWRGSVTYDD
jgi:hypothetical protein